jgi:hypothetical protein
MAPAAPKVSAVLRVRLMRGRLERQTRAREFEEDLQQHHEHNAEQNDPNVLRRDGSRTQMIGGGREQFRVDHRLRAPNLQRTILEQNRHADGGDYDVHQRHAPQAQRAVNE